MNIIYDYFDNKENINALKLIMKKFDYKHKYNKYDDIVNSLYIYMHSTEKRKKKFEKLILEKNLLKYIIPILKSNYSSSSKTFINNFSSKNEIIFDFENDLLFAEDNIIDENNHEDILFLVNKIKDDNYQKYSFWLLYYINNLTYQNINNLTKYSIKKIWTDVQYINELIKKNNNK